MQHGLNRWVKTIANTAFMTRIGYGPHLAHYAPGYYGVMTDGTRVDDQYCPDWPNHSRISLHHYVTKSLQARADGRQALWLRRAALHC